MSTKWADVEVEDASPAGRSGQRPLATAPDENGIKTVIEYVERAGKSYKITKKVKVQTVTHKVSVGALARRDMPKFLDSLGGDADDIKSKMGQEAEEVTIEPRVKRKDDDAAIAQIFGTAKKNVWAKFRGPTKEDGAGAGDSGAAADRCAAKDEASAPTSGEPGRYVPPSMRGTGGATSLMDLRMQEQKDRDALTLRVTNLSEDVREGDLAELFAPCGRIQRIFLGKNPETKASKGFAFITFSTRADAEKAIKRLDGHGYDNLVIRVAFSKPSAPRDQPSGPVSSSDFRAQLNTKAF